MKSFKLFGKYYIHFYIRKEKCIGLYFESYTVDIGHSCTGDLKIGLIFWRIVTWIEEE